MFGIPRRLRIYLLPTLVVIFLYWRLNGLTETQSKEVLKQEIRDHATSKVKQPQREEQTIPNPKQPFSTIKAKNAVPEVPPTSIPHVTVTNNQHETSAPVHQLEYLPRLDKPGVQLYENTQVFLPPNCTQAEKETCGIIEPSFILMGGQKCGTTSLFSYLMHHHQLVPLHNSTKAFGQKEIRFFDRPLARYTSNISMYMVNYIPLRQIEEYGKKKNTRLVTGESTPNYMFMPEAASRIQKLYPNMKMVFLLRDPVERAWSHFKHALRSEINDKMYSGGHDFPVFIAEEIKIMDACQPDLHSWEDFINCHRGRAGKAAEKLDIPVRGPPKKSENGTITKHGPRLIWLLQSLARGLYVKQLEHVMQYFPTSQMLVIKSEDFYDNTEDVMKRVTRFLGVDDIDWTDAIKTVYNFGEKNKVFVENADTHKTNKKKSTVPLAIRHQLQVFFQPFNDKLVKLFRDGGFKAWNYPPAEDLNYEMEEDLANSNTAQ